MQNVQPKESVEVTGNKVTRNLFFVKKTEMPETKQDGNELNHVAIIMDGNNRWATAKGLSTAEGHQKGAETLKALLPHAIELGIRFLTVFAFSTENWKRPSSEIDAIATVLGDTMNSQEERRFLQDHGIRVRLMGELETLRQRHPRIVQELEKTMELTKQNTTLDLVVAFSYGGRQEIVSACNEIVREQLTHCIKRVGNPNEATDVLKPTQITEQAFHNYLYEPEVPDVDILIRTSGVRRLSNFLLWQASYAEIFFVKALWPDFSPEELDAVVLEYQTIKRNFGART